MPVPAEQKIKFFVYIIESPSEIDIYHNRSEGTLIQKAINLHSIPCVIRTVISAEAFGAALKIGLVEEMKSFPSLLPVIHISAHGSNSGIQLSNREVITWNMLREQFVPINEALNGYLLLCMSSCEGYGACQMAMELPGSKHPFFSMVGHAGTPVWSDTAVAYTAFYHLFAKGYYVAEAVEAMKVASGDTGFMFTTAESAQKSYIEYINSVNINAAQATLQNQIDTAPPSPEAKKLELGRK